MRLGPHKGITWPDEPEKRLGMKLLLFRAVAAGDAGYLARLAHAYIPSSDRNIENSAKRFIDQVFRPMAKELRKYLEEKVGEVAAVPTSEGFVPLDHNSAGYIDVQDALEALERALVQSNDFPEAEEREQRVAEVSAARRLLNAVRVRLSALAELLRPLLKDYAKGLRGAIIAAAVTATMAALTGFFGGLLTTLLN